MFLTISLLVPLLGTILGSTLVFFMKDKINERLEKILLGFASGVMVSASVWSLMLPSIEMAEEQNLIKWMPAAVGFLLGILFLLLLDNLIPHLHVQSNVTEGVKSNFRKTTMMFFAVTLHNIPEGLAVGITIAGALYGNMHITLAGALALSIGIAIQNFPEGAIVSMPLKAEGVSKFKAFLFGTLSGVVEPIASVLTILLTSQVTKVLPYFLSFAAGAMMYVVAEELIPDSQNGKHTNTAMISLGVGFVLMMILDITFG